MPENSLLFQESFLTQEQLSKAQKLPKVTLANQKKKLGQLVQKSAQAKCKDKKTLQAILGRVQMILNGPDRIKLEGQTEETPNAFKQSIVQNPGPQFLSVDDLKLLYKGVDLSLALDRNDLYVENKTIQQCLIDDNEPNPTVAVPANAFFPGGANSFDSNDSESTLCQNSDLYLHIPSEYPNDRACLMQNFPVGSGLSQMGHAYRIQGAALFELVDEEEDSSLQFKTKFNAVFTAAPNFSIPNARVNAYCNAEQPAGRADYISYMAMLVRLQCAHAIEAGSDLLYAGSLGCEKYNNNPYLVAAIYRMVLNEPAYRGLNVKFAIAEDANKPSHAYHLPQVFEKVFAANPERVKEIIRNARPYSTDAIKIKGNHPLNQPIGDFFKATHQLYMHAKDNQDPNSLISRHYFNEAAIAEQAYLGIRNLFINFVEALNDPTQDFNAQRQQMLINLFKERVTDYLRNQVLIDPNTQQQFHIYSVLARHREGKQILLNILGSLLTLGIGFVIGMKNYIQQGRFDMGFFRANTHSQKLIEDLIKKVNAIPSNALPVYTAAKGEPQVQINPTEQLPAAPELLVPVQPEQPVEFEESESYYSAEEEDNEDNDVHCPPSNMPCTLI